MADVFSQIIAEVRKGGDAALKRYAEQFDGAAPAVFEVSEEERAAPELKKAIRKSDKAADKLDAAKAGAYSCLP